jgi:hypothetical protein
MRPSQPLRIHASTLSHCLKLRFFVFCFEDTSCLYESYIAFLKPHKNCCIYICVLVPLYARLNTRSPSLKLMFFFFENSHIAFRGHMYKAYICIHVSCCLYAPASTPDRPLWMTKVELRGHIYCIKTKTKTKSAWVALHLQDIFFFSAFF